MGRLCTVQCGLDLTGIANSEETAITILNMKTNCGACASRLPRGTVFANHLLGQFRLGRQ